MSGNVASVNEGELEDEVLDESVEADEGLMYTGAISFHSNEVSGSSGPSKSEVHSGQFQSSSRFSSQVCVAQQLILP
jgi:hypothetical protein